jgi:hypothetical protein
MQRGGYIFNTHAIGPGDQICHGCVLSWFLSARDRYIHTIYCHQLLKLGLNFLDKWAYSKLHCQFYPLSSAHRNDCSDIGIDSFQLEGNYFGPNC